MTDFENLTLTTQRLRLRSVTMADVSFFVALYSDPRIAERMLIPCPPNPERVHSIIAASIAAAAGNHSVRLLIVNKASGTPMGHLVYNRSAVDCPLSPQEFGYSLAFDHHGQGYGYEAVSAFFDWHFQDQNQPEVKASVATDNQASLKLLQKYGFEHTGTIDLKSDFNQKTITHDTLSLCKQTYETRLSRQT